MENFKWLPQMIQGIAVMDATDKALLKELQFLAEAPDEKMGLHLWSLLPRIESEFLDKETAIRELDLSGLARYREQHARLIGSLHEIANAIVLGNYSSARNALDSLQQWFESDFSKMEVNLAVKRHRKNWERQFSGQQYMKLMNRKNLDSCGTT